ncbi:NAD(P)-binding protein [Apiospora rasikravindrae]|uniref:NAD(P)-binding protein n=1 Tax=Apiospora rasikravindrae TaxID=990691 RepID=A0ABR1RWH8_9PEZI
MASITQIISWIVQDIYHGWSPLPLPPAGSFAGQTVCVVGGSTGLGLAAAEHCVNLGAAEVIITSRDNRRVSVAKEYLEGKAAKAAAATTVGKEESPPPKTECRVTAMTLDMNRYSSVVAFANDLKQIRKGQGGIDFILLNAAVIQSRYIQSPEGWQEELQVNTLGNVMLTLLLLPWLRAERENRSSPAHIAFTTSTASIATDVSKWEGWSTSGEGILNHWNKKENWPPGLSGGYPVSKVMLMYADRELNKLVVGPDGKPWVIINSMEPGMVKTEIQRHVLEDSPFLQFLAPTIIPTIFKTSENGARILIMGKLTTEEEHGHRLSRVVPQEEYRNMPVVASPMAKRLQQIVWNEITDILTKAVPEAKDALDELRRQ